MLKGKTSHFARYLILHSASAGTTKCTVYSYLISEVKKGGGEGVVCPSFLIRSMNTSTHDKTHIKRHVTAHVNMHVNIHVKTHVNTHVETHVNTHVKTNISTHVTA